MSRKIAKQMKKDKKVTIKGPNVKERKHFAPPSKTHKPKKGKGSYDRTGNKEEDEEVPISEAASIIKLLDCIMNGDQANAHKNLQDIVNQKIQARIAAEMDTPLF